MAEWYGASVSWAVDSGLIPSRVKPMTFKIGIHSFPSWRLALKGQCGEQAGKFRLLVVPLGKALSGNPHLGVVDRCPATPKRARIAHWSLPRDRRINMQLNKKKSYKKIKSSLYSRYYPEACNLWRNPSPQLSAWAAQLRRNVAAVASRWRRSADLNDPGFEPQISRTDGVCGYALSNWANGRLLKKRKFAKPSWCSIAWSANSSLT